MKKLSTYLFLIFFSFSAPSFADDKKELKVFKDYSYDLNDNIINYGWKIKSVRKTNDKEIYILNKNNWIMYCVVFFADEEIETTCSIP
jgi:thioredoxin-related protein